MCGIFGLLQFNDTPVSPEELASCRDVLKHRGPDGEGLWISDDRRVGLAHRRLAILDISEAGLQPMRRSPAGPIIIFNGEIFNYRELREELKSTGTEFMTGTDTEVILAAYERWGEACVDRFNGMWAFAIWDAPRRRLFCSRDRLGIKPFYYHLDHQSFCFASEIKALLASNRLHRHANGAAVYDYLNFGRKDHMSSTFVEGVTSLSAAHNLVVRLDGRAETRPYWNLSVNHSTTTFSPAQRRDAATHLLDLLRDAVRIHLRSDVQTGICLSGGLDSSTIALLASDLLRRGEVDQDAVPGRLRCYTSHFPGEPIDETRYAEQIVAAADAQGAWVVPDGEKLFDRLDTLIYHLDEPFVSSSLFAQWTVIERAALDGVKVLLDGQGGDEVFGGYPPYSGVYLIHLCFSGQVLRALKEGFRLQYGPNPRPWSTAVAELSRLLYALLPAPLRAIARGHVRAVGRFLQPGFVASHAARDRVVASSPRRTNLQDRLYDDTTRTNLPSLLRYEDRISMAFGIEARVPLLDYRVVEYAFSLPAVAKIHDGWSKSILRDAMAGILPDTIRLRRDKLGFPTPQRRWLLTRIDWIRTLFSQRDLATGAFLRGGAIARALPQLLGTDAGAREVWRWLCLELWMRRFSLASHG